MNRARGFFTLIELLVALAVFVLMAVMAYGGLSSVLSLHEGVDKALDNGATIHAAMHRIEADVEQTVQRPVRDQFGDPQPALLGAPDTGLIITCDGWRNPLGEPRSNLERVAYRVDADNDLVRDHWRVLDRAPDSKPVETVLLKDVKDVEWRYLDSNREWQDRWPPASVVNGAANNTGAAVVPPLAVELRITTPAWGALRYLFMIPGTGQ